MDKAPVKVITIEWDGTRHSFGSNPRHPTLLFFKKPFRNGRRYWRAISAPEWEAMFPASVRSEVLRLLGVEYHGT